MDQIKASQKELTWEEKHDLKYSSFFETLDDLKVREEEFSKFLRLVLRQKGSKPNKTAAPDPSKSVEFCRLQSRMGSHSPKSASKTKIEVLSASGRNSQMKKQQQSTEPKFTIFLTEKPTDLSVTQGANFINP